MTMTNDEMLMRYLDGELTPTESRAVERDLSASSELARKRDALLEMRDLLRARFEVAEDEVEPQLVAMWERVRSALPSTPARLVRRRSSFERMRDWLESYRSHLVTGVLAAAAGAMIATFVTSKMAATLPLGAGAGASAAAESAEVESLEVLGGSGMVFQEPAADKNDTGTTVIWVTANEPSDDGDDDGNPATPPVVPAPGGTL
jgi:anti-sigma factor RsiW